MRHKVISIAYDYDADKRHFSDQIVKEYYDISKAKKSTNRLYLNCLKECVKIALEKEITGIEKECLIEYYYKEKMMKEIAEKRGVDISTISRHIKKGKRNIKSKLEYFEAIYKLVFNELTRDDYL